MIYFLLGFLFGMVFTIVGTIAIAYQCSNNGSKGGGHHDNSKDE